MIMQVLLGLNPSLPSDAEDNEINRSVMKAISDLNQKDYLNKPKIIRIINNHYRKQARAFSTLPN